MGGVWTSSERKPVGRRSEHLLGTWVNRGITKEGRSSDGPVPSLMTNLDLWLP